MNGISRNFLLPGSVLLLACAAAAQPPKQPRRAAEFLRARHAAPPGVSPGALRADAVRRFNEMLRSRPAAEDAKQWQLIGPQPTVTTLPPLTATGAPLSSGRITSLVVDPRSSAVVYAGAAMGGVWKTVDGGKQWTPLTDDQVSLAIGSLAMDPSNPDIVYAGTGEANFSGDSYYGAGVLKSADAGATWRNVGAPVRGPLSANSGGASIGALAVHPARGQIVLAGVYSTDMSASGVWRSADGGATWSLTSLKGAPATALLFDPSSPDVVYAGLGDIYKANPLNGVYRSTDAGVSWTPAMAGIPTGNIGRISLAITNTLQPVLYAAVAKATQAGPLGVFTSADRASTWQAVPESTVSYCYNYCYYTNTIQVHPEDSKLVVVGGEAIDVSRDGGATWQWVNVGSNGVNVHADVHALAFSADGTRLYVGSDGGVVAAERLRSSTGADVGWHNLNDTLALTQFYPGCSQHPEDAAFIVCGTQDNGVQVYSGGKIWQTIYTGDGGYTAIDDAEPAVYYLGNGGIVDVQRTAPFGLFHGLYPVINGLYTDYYDNPCSELPPLATDPAHPLRMYWGCWQLYRTEDGGGEWQPISPTLHKAPGDPGFIAALAVAPSDSGRVYIGTSHGRVHTTANATAGSSSQWQDVSTGLPRRDLTWIAVDAADPRVAYVSYGGFSGFGDRLGHVFETRDAGAHWTDISANLPNIPVNAIALDAAVPGAIYIGTDVGVFSRDGGAWQPLGSGLPRAAVLDLRIQQPFRLLRAATHGRSMWQYPLPPASTGAPEVSSVTLTGTALVVNGARFASDAIVRWNGVPRASVPGAGGLIVQLSANDAAAAGRASVAVCNPGKACTRAFNVNVGGPPAIAAVVNAANPAAPQLAPGTLASIYGSNLSPVSVASVLAPPFSLGGTTVEIRDTTQHESIQAPLLSVAPDQVNFIVPSGLNPSDGFAVGVVNGRRFSPTVPVKFGYLSPAIFFVFTISGGVNLANPGDAVALWATGLGPAHPDGQGGQVTYVTPVVTFGGISSPVTSSSVAPFNGLYIVLTTVPANVPPGPVDVVLTAGGIVSNTVKIVVLPQ